MIAYNTKWLDNLIVQNEANSASEKGCISKEENATIQQQYPVGFYMPNPFVRIGLFILTVIIAFFSFGLISLLFISGGNENLGFLSIFFGVITYIMLEIMVRSKNHYKSGVDDALMWMAAAFIITGLNFIGNLTSVNNAIIVFIIAFYFTVRFVNTIIAAVAFLSLLAIVFLSYLKLGPVAKATTPFLLMLITSMLYFYFKKQLGMKQWKYYTNCFTIIIIAALVCFFLEGNYFVVRETSNNMFNLNLKEGESIPYGWIFWLLTFFIPILYIFQGLKAKDKIVLRIGALLIVGIVFTFRFYYHVVSTEIAMTTGGVILIILAYALTKYLALPKHGFTAQLSSDKHFMDSFNIEAIVIAETYVAPPVAPTQDNTLFGGGSGGGGGASGNY